MDYICDREFQLLRKVRTFNLFDDNAYLESYDVIISPLRTVKTVRSSENSMKNVTMRMINF